MLVGISTILVLTPPPTSEQPVLVSFSSHSQWIIPSIIINHLTRSCQTRPLLHKQTLFLPSIYNTHKFIIQPVTKLMKVPQKATVRLPTLQSPSASTSKERRDSTGSYTLERQSKWNAKSKNNLSSHDVGMGGSSIDMEACLWTGLNLV